MLKLYIDLTGNAGLEDKSVGLSLQVTPFIHK